MMGHYYIEEWFRLEKIVVERRRNKKSGNEGYPSSGVARRNKRKGDRGY